MSIIISTNRYYESSPSTALWMTRRRYLVIAVASFDSAEIENLDWGMNISNVSAFLQYGFLYNGFLYFGTYSPLRPLLLLILSVSDGLSLAPVFSSFYAFNKVPDRRVHGWFIVTHRFCHYIIHCCNSGCDVLTQKIHLWLMVLCNCYSFHFGLAHFLC